MSNKEEQKQDFKKRQGLGFRGRLMRFLRITQNPREVPSPVSIRTDEKMDSSSNTVGGAQHPLRDSSSLVVQQESAGVTVAPLTTSADPEPVLAMISPKQIQLSQSVQLASQSQDSPNSITNLQPVTPPPRNSPRRSSATQGVSSELPADGAHLSTPRRSISTSTRRDYVPRHPDEYEYENLDEHPLHDDQSDTVDVADGRYSKKDLIRILTLLPGDGNDIYCRLDVRQIPALDARGRKKKMYEYGKEVEIESFNALSYAWGTSLPSRNLRVCRQNSGNNSQYKNLKITESLYSALKVLRHKTKDRRFWADAVCMNQKDDDEKNKQLTYMARIYKEAAEVTVWLGPNDDDTHLAFGLIDTLRNTEDFRTFVEQNTTVEEWDAFAKMLTKTWFSRRWVVQEISLATRAEIWCGEQHKPWEHLSEAVSLFVLVGDRVKAKFRASTEGQLDKFGDIAEFSANQLVTLTSDVVTRDDDHRVIQMAWTLEYLISKLTPFHAGEPRDVIYAMLSLARDVKAITAEPIYEVRIDNVPQVFLKGRDPEHVKQTLARVLKYLQVDKFTVDYKKDFLDVSLDLLRFTTYKSESIDMILRPWAPHRSDLEKAMIAEQTKELELEMRNAASVEEHKELQNDLKTKKKSLRKTLKEDKLLPSWIKTLDDVPFARGMEALTKKEDGHRWERQNADLLVGLPGEGTYKAYGRIPGSWEFVKRPDGRAVLSIKGFSFERLITIEPSARGGVIPREWLKHATIADEDEDEDGELMADQQTISESFWRSMVAGRAPVSHDGKNPPPHYRTLSYATFATGNSHKREIKLELSRTGTNNPLYANYLKRVEAVVWNRALAKLEQCGRLALVPEQSQAGDVVCILFGCSVPVVLRQLKGKENVHIVHEKAEGSQLPMPVEHPLYEIIGECYVHGFMDGEAIGFRNDRIEEGGKQEKNIEFYSNRKFNIC